MLLYFAKTVRNSLNDEKTRITSTREKVPEHIVCLNVQMATTFFMYGGAKAKCIVAL